MNIKKWQIFHTYSTYADFSSDLDDIAYRLIRKGVGLVSFKNDGVLLWMHNGHIHRDRCTLESMDDFGHARYGLPQSKEYDEADPMVHEYVYQFLNFHYAEENLLRFKESFPHEYIRVFLGPMEMYNSEFDWRIFLYPTILIYETGVMTLELRVFSGGEQSLDDFIEYNMNVCSYKFNEALLNPNIVKYAIEAWNLSHKKNFINRIGSLIRFKISHSLLKTATTIHDDGEFKYQLAPLSNVDGEKLSSLSLSVFSVVEFAVNQKVNYLNYMLLGKLNFDSRGRWYGRPHTYLIEFEDQQSKSRDNELIHEDSLKKMFIRSVEVRKDKVDLPKSCRMFDDYSCYLGESHSIWVWSKMGLNRDPNPDVNFGHLVCFPQLMIEFLDYIHILYYKLLAEIDKSSDLESVYHLKQGLCFLTMSLKHPSRFGEVNDMLQRGWDMYGLEALATQVEHNLNLKTEILNLRESKRKFKLTTILAIVFGLVAVPSLSSSVIQPLWKFFNFFIPENAEVFKLCSSGVSLSIVVLVVFLCFLWVFKR